MTVAAGEQDFYQFAGLLTEEEQALRARVRQFCEREVIPSIGPYWERGEFPAELIPKLAALGVAGGTIAGYGCPGLSSVAAGLVSMELGRADGSVATFFGVTSGLAMGAIAYGGSEEQKQRWLPAMARLEKIGAFGLTEPDVGSDASHLAASAVRVGDRYVLNGEKRWIGNATLADVTVIWARNEETGQVNGFLVERGTPGFRAEAMAGKIAKRAILNAHITLENCEIGEAQRLPGCDSFRDTAAILRNTRASVAWEAVGHAAAAYEIALAYALGRRQFDRPIAGFQLIQQKLVQMLGDLTAMQLLVWRLATLRDAGTITDGQASLAKQHCAARARQVVALAREIMGGNGLLLDYHLARHFTDMEAVYTYEGTNEVNTLIVGREITGIAAFA
ncbi:MAG TPA: acyl-CoA dehydrogenase family protein [Herpetosiphonaceae bacterium]